jgi:hypothetical protein
VFRQGVLEGRRDEGAKAMALKLRAHQRLRKLVKSVGPRLDTAAQGELAALPPGWAGLAGGMIAQVERVLTDEEFETFRWTRFGCEDGRLTVAWTGAQDSQELIDQIVEAAVDVSVVTCADCGLPALKHEDGSKPLCLVHSGLGRAARGKAALGKAAREWLVSPAELSRAIREIVAKKLSPAAAAPKAVAAALPALLAEAQAYFRTPDADAVALVKQIREALHRLEGEVRQSVGVSVVPERS